MSKDSGIINTNIHFNLSKEADRKAWNHLQHRDKTKYRSYSRTIVTALNDYFQRQQQLEADPLLESRERENAFLEKVKESIAQELRQCMSGFSMSINPQNPSVSQVVDHIPTDSGLEKDQLNRDLSDRMLDMFI